LLVCGKLTPVTRTAESLPSPERPSVMTVTAAVRRVILFGAWYYSPNQPAEPTHSRAGDCCVATLLAMTGFLPGSPRDGRSFGRLVQPAARIRRGRTHATRHRRSLASAIQCSGGPDSSPSKASSTSPTIASKPSMSGGDGEPNDPGWASSAAWLITPKSRRAHRWRRAVPVVRNRSRIARPVSSEHRVCEMRATGAGIAPN
jgi:hypothetical protein